MGYRKITAGKIFDGSKFLKDYVLVLDDKDVVQDLLPVSHAGTDILSLEGILSPGIINCHCHLELSHMKGLVAEGTGLVDFVYKIVTGRHHAEEDILKAIEIAEEEMWENGIVAVGDICNNTSTIAQKKKGRLQYYNFIEASGWLPGVSEKRMDAARIIFESFTRELSGTGQQFSIVPHAPYSVSDNLWQKIQPYFKNRVVSIHNQETAFEDEFFLKGTGDLTRMYELMNISNDHHRPSQKTSIQSCYEKLQQAAGILLVHNTFTSQPDLNFVQLQTTDHQPQTSFCLCANANQYIEKAMPPVELFRKNKCHIVLGTDSLASNWSLDIMEEIKTIRRHFPSVPLEEMLQWATLNGARALLMDQHLGSFEKGKKPGLVLINEKDLTAKRIEWSA